ncbi:hypothetical protein SLS64_003984 [Diaporthe eres]|uniref:HAD-superfamily subfamily IIA hydrolase n=1 Tax=Diaporthe eres TaxID=83184 RepID=A0ABR1PQE5_DIAER
MSAASRVTVKALPLLRSPLLARSSGSGFCSYSSVAAARALPRRTPSCRPSSSSSSRGVDAAAVRAWRAEGVRWNSTESSSSSSAGSDDGGSVASSQTSLGSEAEAQPAAQAFSFAFDIDGVLLHTSKPIPGASETLRFLQRNNIPFILLTNGGGKSEAERVADLTEKLGVELDVSNFVQSHTPYQKLLDPDAELGHPKLEKYLEQSLGSKRFSGKETVLVLGSDASKARRIANGYGFESVVTPGDILKACPEIFPFDPLHEFYDRQEILPLPKPIYSPKADPAVKLEDCLKIDAVLTFNDPRDWAVDTQLITDLALSHKGYLGTYSSRNGDMSLPYPERWQSDGQPPLIFSNIDLQWSTGYHQSRLGQGAFHGAVRRVLQDLMPGRMSQHIRTFEFGKPFPAAYAHAWATLHRHCRRLDLPTPKVVYMVGDNPASDIRGTHLWNTHVRQSHRDRRAALGPYWKSLLVRTGVWKEDTVPLNNLPKGKKPYRAVHDVRSAVELALEESKWPGKFE